MKKMLVFAAIIASGLIQSCTKGHGQSQNSLPDVVTIKHKALNHQEVKQRIALGYGMNYRLESAITSCYDQNCITTLVFAK